MRARAAVVPLVALAAACGGGGGAGYDPGMGPDAAPPPAATEFVFTITASGVSPRELRVPVGARVAFVNRDGRSHQMTSNPHPVHTDCPALTVGIVGPGQTRTSGALEVERACGFHDHDRELDETLWGRVMVGAAPGDDTGY
jgi:hypothetical protein